MAAPQGVRGWSASCSRRSVDHLARREIERRLGSRSSGGAARPKVEAGYYRLDLWRAAYWFGDYLAVPASAPALATWPS
jgi:hypothetical protein